MRNALKHSTRQARAVTVVALAMAMAMALVGILSMTPPAAQAEFTTPAGQPLEVAIHQPAPRTATQVDDDLYTDADVTRPEGGLLVVVRTHDR